MEQIQNTNRIIKRANKIIWVERWIRHFADHDSDWEGIVADKLENGKWRSQIELPLVNETITVTADTEVDAMIKIADAGTRCIKKYLDENKMISFIPLSKVRNWEIVSDESGKFLSMGMSSAWRREQGKQTEKMTRDSLEAVKKAIKRLAKINGTSKNLFIQVLDQSLFDKGKSIQDIMNEVNDKIENDYHMSNMTVCYDKDGDSVIVVGYTFPSKEGGLQ